MLAAYLFIIIIVIVIIKSYTRYRK